ncbi:MAG: HNH endonuclease [Clostridia bacterium]|nr:HNH endonuclease [Clostridia bacterium]
MNDNTTSTESGAQVIEYRAETDETIIWTPEEIIEAKLDYVPVPYAAEELGIEKNYLYGLQYRRNISSLKTEKGHVLVSISNVKDYIERKRVKIEAEEDLAFGDLKMDKKPVWQPLLSKKNSSEIYDYYRHEYDFRYFVSNTGLIFNLDSKVYLTPDIKNTYQYINLKKNGKFVHRYIHNLVAYCFCNGMARHGVNRVHHIDENPLNNNAKNLIYVTSAEHGELHKLLKSEDKEDKKAYRQRIKEIRKANNKW